MYIHVFMSIYTIYTCDTIFIRVHRYMSTCTHKQNEVYDQEGNPKTLHINICVCICIHVHIYTHNCIYNYTYVYIFVHIYIDFFLYMYTFVYIYTQTYVCV